MLTRSLLLSMVPALAIGAGACSKKAPPPEPTKAPPPMTKPVEDAAAPAADAAPAPKPDAAAAPAPDAAPAPAPAPDAAAAPKPDAAAPAADAAAAPAADAAAAPADAEAAPTPAPAWSADGFAQPESVLMVADGYLVSNINGTPFDKDDNGFISKLGADGKVVELKWIDGSKPDVELNAPKGMAMAGDVLYVADIDVVRMFDAKTGASKGAVAVPNASFLNDLASSADGKTVYVSDSAVGPGFKPKGTPGIYAIDAKAGDKAVATALDIKGLGAPNGLAVESGADGDAVYFVGIDATKTVTRFDTKSKASTSVPVPAGSLDGLAVLKDGDATWYVVSSWETSSIYKIDKDGKATVVASGVKGPADFAVDAGKKLVVTPALVENRISAFNL